MPFGVDIDEERCQHEIQETLKVFGTLFGKSFAVNLAKKVVDDAINGEDAVDEDSDYQLKQQPSSSAPKQRGVLKRQSTVLKRFKAAFYWITDDYQLAYASNEGAEKPDGVINLWGYKAKSMNQKPEGARRGGPDWIPDDERPECTLCAKKFNLRVWHHHCRNCGEVFCSDCAGNTADLNHFGYDKPQRVCNTCFAKIGRKRANTFAVVHDEMKEDASFQGIQLLHVSRTPYLLECESLDEWKAWLDALEICCAKAKPPVNPDPVLAAAFADAHKEASWRAGIWGRWRITGSESEMIADLLFENVRRTVISPAIYDAETRLSPKVVRTAEKAIKTSILASVRSAADPAWDGMLAGVLKTKEKLVEQMKPIIEPLAQAKQKVLDDLNAKVMDVLKPLLEGSGREIMSKVLDTITSPIQQAHVTLFKTLDSAVGKIQSETKDAGSFKKAMSSAMSAIRGTSGVLKPVHAVLDELSSKLREVQKEMSLLKYIPVTGIINDIRDSVQLLADNALYTLSAQEELKDSPSAEAVSSAWKNVSGQFVHDSQLEVVATFKTLLSVGVVGPIQEKLLQNEQLKNITGPIDSSLPEAMADFISVSSMLEELVNGVCDNTVDLFVEASADETRAKLAAEMTPSA